MALADLPLSVFLNQAVVPYETDEVTRLIIDTHDATAFAAVSHLTVGSLRDWLLSDEATTPALAALAPGLTPEMVAAVAKIMRLQDLMIAASRVQVTTAFRCTIGLPGRLSVRLQPNHPSDDPRGIAASILDGLLLGAGDACIGINPATDSPARTLSLLQLLDDIRQRLDIPMQSCVLAHVHHLAGPDPPRRPAGPRVPIRRRNPGRQRRLRHRPGPARRGRRRRRRPASRHRGHQRHVFRDRPGPAR